MNELSPVELFKKAEALCLANGFDKEIDWCEDRPSFDSVNARTFLVEYAWVVYNSGMKNSVIEAKWNDIRSAFEFFDYYEISRHPDAFQKRVLAVFANTAKVNAVIMMATKLASSTSYFENLKQQIQKDPLTELDKLHYIGSVTKYHLARNLGFDFIKPDRHLVRLAEKYNMTPFEFCDIIHKETRRRLGVIDVILWRYCEQAGQMKLSKSLNSLPLGQ